MGLLKWAKTKIKNAQELPKCRARGFHVEYEDLKCERCGIDLCNLCGGRGSRAVWSRRRGAYTSTVRCLACRGTGELQTKK